jgi:hypothetical protein
MIRIMTYLEPRIEKAGSVLFEELDEINEVIFIMMGTIEIGFEINKTRKFVIRFDKSHMQGAYNCIFDERSMFIVMCKTECSGYFIRKHKWKSVLKEFPDVRDQFQQMCHEEYTLKIKNKMIEIKDKYLRKYKSRADFNQILSVQPNEYN